MCALLLPSRRLASLCDVAHALPNLPTATVQGSKETYISSHHVIIQAP